MSRNSGEYDANSPAGADRHRLARKPQPRHGAGVANRPLTVVVPTAAGGGADILARILAVRMAELLGQPVVIENVGNAVASTNRVAKGQPEGYLVHFGNTAHYAYHPTLYKTPVYNPRTEFTPLFQRQAVVQPPLREQTATIEAPLLADGPRLGDLQGRVIGQYRMSYIVIDTPTGLRLIDQHVAHERVLYDRYFERAAEQAPMTQQLLTPILYENGAAESAVLESHLAELRVVGFDIERFSGNVFAIAAVPPELIKNDVEAFLRKLVDASLDERSHLLHVREKVCASLACQAAIKVHRPLNGEEMARLTAELLDSSNPFACPHGRPIIVDIRHLDIEKHFHRK